MKLTNFIHNLYPNSKVVYEDDQIHIINKDFALKIKKRENDWKFQVNFDDTKYLKDIQKIIDFYSKIQ